MKYCPYCGNEMQDEMKFCTMCGKQYYSGGNNTREPQYEQVYTQPTAKPEKPHILRTILIVLGSIFAFLIVLSILGNLFASNTPEPEIDIEEQYKKAVGYYDMRHYEEALEKFSALDDDYKSTHLYKILCNGYIHHHLPDEDIRELKNNMDFADTKSLLLSDTWLAVSFLNGYWRSENKKYNLEVYDQGDYTHVSTNLPYKQVKNEGEGFYIEDGVYGHYLKNKDEESENEGKHDMYRFSILGADKIAVVCLKDDTRIIMIRE